MRSYEEEEKKRLLAGKLELELELAASSGGARQQEWTVNKARTADTVGVVFDGLSTTLFFLSWLAMVGGTFPFMGPFRPVALTVSYSLQTAGYLCWKCSAYIHSGNYSLMDRAYRQVGRPLSGAHMLLQKRQIHGPAVKFEKGATYLGVLACLALLISAFVPPAVTIALLVGLWIMTASNGSWAYSCQKQVEASDAVLSGDESPTAGSIRQLRLSQHRSYRNFAILLTITSIVVAVAATLSVFCPPAAVFLSMVLVAGITTKMTLVGGFGLAGMGCLVYSFYNRRKADRLQNGHGGTEMGSLPSSGPLDPLLEATA